MSAKRKHESKSSVSAKRRPAETFEQHQSTFTRRIQEAVRKFPGLLPATVPVADRLGCLRDIGMRHKLTVAQLALKVRKGGEACFVYAFPACTPSHCIVFVARVCRTLVPRARHIVLLHRPLGSELRCQGQAVGLDGLGVGHTRKGQHRVCGDGHQGHEPQIALFSLCTIDAQQHGPSRSYLQLCLGVCTVEHQ
jgi:hypothetical protein